MTPIDPAYVEYCEKALALPSDNTALQARLAEEREKIIQKLLPLQNLWKHIDLADALRSMK